MALITFAPWRPDLPARDNPGALEAKNVVPKISSYGPFPDFSASTDALTARAQGAFSCRALDGTIHNFAGDATKLYKLDSGGDNWEDVSRTAGGAYAAATDGGWSFTQFGNVIVAVDGVDAPQAFTLGSSTDFAALAGSPPVARFVATVRDFVVLGRVSSLFNEVRWSAFEDPTDWTQDPTGTQADLQDIPDGGFVMGIVGGPAGTIFQRYAISRMTYIGGDFVFQFDTISKSIGCMAENSIASYQNNMFFLSDDGFWQLRNGIELVPIGANAVNNTFFNGQETAFDSSYPYRVVGTIDPKRSIYVVIYPGPGNSSGTPNMGFLYHWPSDRWARFSLDLEWVYAFQSQSGFTLDQLDTPLPSIDGSPQISFDSPFWSGSGNIILGGFNTDHKQGTFSGAALEATIDTGEFSLTPGRRSLVTSIRPVCDGGTLSVTPITRNIPAESPTVGSAVTVDSIGNANLRSEGRYHRARVKVAAGGTWQHLHGIDDLVVRRLGMR